MSEHTPERLTDEESLAIADRTSVYGLISDELGGRFDFVLAKEYAAILASNADLLAALEAYVFALDNGRVVSLTEQAIARAAIAKARGE